MDAPIIAIDNVMVVRILSLTRMRPVSIRTLSRIIRKCEAEASLIMSFLLDRELVEPDRELVKIASSEPARFTITEKGEAMILEMRKPDRRRPPTIVYPKRSV